jgi:hypothetical protein
MRKRKEERSDVQLVIDGVRKDWMTYPKKFAAIQKQAIRVVLPSGRKKTLIQCACCGGLFPRDKVEANHKYPVGPLADTSEEAVDAYRQRMFCSVRDIEALCKECHRHTTKLQRKEKGRANAAI